LTLTVARYPTGASKWNPVEHRFFSEISKNRAGEPPRQLLEDLDFIRPTKLKPARQYPAGTEPTPEQLQSLRLKPHEVLPKWHDTISLNL
jgi:hypothetical protein